MRALRRDIILSQMPVLIVSSALCAICAVTLAGHFALVLVLGALLLWLSSLPGVRVRNRILRDLKAAASACEGTESPPFDYEEFSLVASVARKAQAKARQRDRQGAQILDSMPCGYSLLDARGRYIGMNPKGAEILGVDPRDVLGKFAADLAKGRSAGEPPALKALREDQAVEGVFSVLVHGQTRSIRGTCFPVTLESEEPGSVAVYVDVTEQVEMERSLQRLALLGSLGETLSIVAHDIRNPLAAIKSRAQMATLMGDRLNHPQEWARVSTLVDEITAYLTQLLTYCRPGGEGVEVCDVRDLFRKSTTVLQSRITYSSAQLIEDISEPSPQVAVNPVEFGHVLINLLNNAIDAVQGDGSITFRSRLRGPDVVVEVEDTGSGIPPDQIDHIWDMFYTTKATGSGIGLAVCRRVIERMGGTIAAASTPGEGTTFTVVLPAAAGVTETAV